MTVRLAFSADGERVMGLEPTTATLATWRSTTELHPRAIGCNGTGDSVVPLNRNYKGAGRRDKGGIEQVPRAGLEPAPLAGQASKTCVAASYTTSALSPPFYRMRAK